MVFEILWKEEEEQTIIFDMNEIERSLEIARRRYCKIYGFINGC
jgi:hypothetical protein